MNRWMLYWGAFVMLILGITLKLPNYIVSGLTLMWIGSSIKNEVSNG